MTEMTKSQWAQAIENLSVMEEEEVMLTTLAVREKYHRLKESARQYYHEAPEDDQECSENSNQGHPSQKIEFG